MPTPKSPKTMSSRLLTMKFMQRAAAAAASSTSTNTNTHTPSTPSTSQLQQQQSYDTLKTPTPSPKRQKNSSHSKSTPSTPATGNADLEAISAAIRAEEEKRAAAIARQAAEAGEEEWVIEYPPGTFPEPHPQTAMDGGSVYGFGDVGDEEVMGGRQSFGGFKRKGRKGLQATATSSSHNANADGDVDGDGDGDDEDEENDDGHSGSGSSDNDDDDDDDGLDALLKAAKQKSEKKRAEKRWNAQNSKKRKSGDDAVDLSRLTSISGGVDKGEQQRQHKRHRNQWGGGGGGRKGRR
ncbi:hypothetical protein BDFG_08876 [Blastomyces dermatitidis ATCC 26199]|nr:hypothetical protein BDFG_08876 [Blastomyces dermatitidis ATCC 26199]